MASRGPATKLTYDDYVLIPEDGKRHEIMAGEEYESPSPRVRHQDLVARLHLKIGIWLERHPAGGLWTAPLDVVLSPEDVVQPDLLFVRQERPGIVTAANIQGAPDLVAEVLSENYRRRDEILKRKLYDQFRVADYWIVDPELETVKVYRQGAAGYGPAMELSREAGAALSTPLLPGFELPLAELFR